MAKESGHAAKFTRIFEMFDDLRERIVRVETSEAVEQNEIAELRADVKRLQETMNQFVGRHTVMAAIYGVVGAIISGVVVWMVSIGRGGN